MFNNSSFTKLAERARQEIPPAVDVVNQVMNRLQTRFDGGRLRTGKDLSRALREHLGDILAPCEQPLEIPRSDTPFVILMVGVNGVGKTTSIAKLAHHFKQAGDPVRTEDARIDLQRVNHWLTVRMNDTPDREEKPTEPDAQDDAQSEWEPPATEETSPPDDASESTSEPETDKGETVDKIKAAADKATKERLEQEAKEKAREELEASKGQGEQVFGMLEECPTPDQADAFGETPMKPINDQEREWLANLIDDEVASIAAHEGNGLVFTLGIIEDVKIRAKQAGCAPMTAGWLLGPWLDCHEEATGDKGGERRRKARLLLRAAIHVMQLAGTQITVPSSWRLPLLSRQ